MNDNNKPVEGLKGKFVSEPKDFSVPLMTEEFKKNYAADLKEQIIRKAKVNREWAKDHLEIIMQKGLLMSVYRLPRNRKNDYRTKSYCFTVASKDDPSLVALKEGIALANAQVRKRARTWQKINEYDKLYTVRLMGRGPRRWHTKYQPTTARYLKGTFKTYK